MRVLTTTLILWLLRSSRGDTTNIDSQFYTLDLESSCLLISKYKIWPFADRQKTTPANFAGVAPNARRICNELGTSPAILEDPRENLALQRWKSCTETLPVSLDRILLGHHTAMSYSDSIGEEGHKCYYHNFVNDTLEYSDSKDCIEQFLPPSGSTTGPVHFACKKYESCDKLDCIPNPNRPEKCYRLLQPPKGFYEHSEAETVCNLQGGNLLVLESYSDFELIKNEFGNVHKKYWLAMKGQLKQKDFKNKNCEKWVNDLDETLSGFGAFGALLGDVLGLTACFDDYEKFYWDLTLNNKRIPITKANYPKGFSVEFRTVNPKTDESPQECFVVDFKDSDPILKSRKCYNEPKNSYPPATICEFSTASKTQLQSDDKGSKLSCEDPPAPPSNTRLILDTETKPDHVCPYESVSYKCNAGGVNKFYHDMSQDTIDVLCHGDTFQYVLPEEWPRCTANAVCHPPYVNSGVMEVHLVHLLSEDEYIEENEQVRINCVHQKKRLVKKSDWIAGNASTIDSITLTCLNSTEYDVDLSEYICTPACVRPYNTAELVPEWTDTAQPELGDTVNYRCNGSQIVSKADFEVGTDRNALKDYVSVTCAYTGRYEPDFLDYTCPLEECGIPTNYSQVMNYDYTEGSSTTVGSIINYQCLDPTQMIAHSANEDFLENKVQVECLFNGRWSYSIEEFGCTHCERPMKPLNGKFDCESFNFTEQSSCLLRCDSGYVPEGPTKMTCKFGTKNYNPNAGKSMYFWDVNNVLFKCVKPISMVIGGIGTNHQYLKDIELFAPERKCSGNTLKVFPRATAGMAGAFVSGYAVVCGGAANTYVDCERTKYSKTCERNVECITTAGEAQWCSGPKMKDCYVYNPFITDTFEPTFKLKTERAFAASVVLPDGTLWILGGAGRNAVLDTTEYVMYDLNRRSWKVKAGPKLPVALMGHCAALISIDQVLVNGGFGIFQNDTDDYTANTYVYNLKTGEWKGRNWMRSKLGPKMDHVCIPYKDMIVSVGGWNNNLINQTEIYRSNHWSVMENKTALAIRSATTIELNTKPYVLGGVSCIGSENQRKICHKVSDIYEFSDDEWSLTDLQMTIPRSSHLAIHAPVTYFPDCTEP